MKTPAQTQRGSFRTPGRLGWLFLLTALATSFSVQAVEPEMNIECGGDGTAVITCHDSSNEWIVVSSSSLAGPWIPRLEPMIPGSGSFQMTVSATDQCEYFRLARGQRFVDDFEDGDLEGWSITYYIPEFGNYVTLETTNGQLHVRGECPSCDWRGRLVLFSRTNLLLADFALSVDILWWDESYSGDHPNIWLNGRVDLSSAGPTDAYVYSGGVGMQYYANPNQSRLKLTKKTGPTPTEALGFLLFPKTNPAKDYRLVFYGVGSVLTVQLFDLTDGTLAAQHQVTDDTLTEGWVGFLVYEDGPRGVVDFWLDNFRAVGTTPQGRRQR